MVTQVLTASVIWENDRFVARVDRLPLEASGDSEREAQDELINLVRAWIELHDTTSTLGKALDQAGYPGVNEDTELRLEFTE